MSRKFLETSVGFDEAEAKSLSQACVERKISRAVLIRAAVSDYIGKAPNTAANLSRMAMTSEFTQVAVDILIREQAPDRREDLLATVQERLERYHA